MWLCAGVLRPSIGLLVVLDGVLGNGPVVRTAAAVSVCWLVWLVCGATIFWSLFRGVGPGLGLVCR